MSLASGFQSLCFDAGLFPCHMVHGRCVLKNCHFCQVGETLASPRLPCFSLWSSSPRRMDFRGSPVKETGRVGGGSSASKVVALHAQGPEFNPQHPWGGKTNWSGRACLYSHGEGGRDTGVSGACWTATLAYWISSRLVGDYLKEVERGGRGRST